jgi:hypothetical protein
MAKKIRLNVHGKSITATLNSSETAKLLFNRLPLKLMLERWGDEYYGDCGLMVNASHDARMEMEIGEIAVWPEGSALCIFFGPTPVSKDHKPRAISPVNPIGKIEEDTTFLKSLPGSIEIEIEKL